MQNQLSQKTIDELIKFNDSNKNNSRYCAALAMEQTDSIGRKTIKVVKRSNEPCYGFLRKYEDTHGEQATEPEERPGDLTHPFPEGIPLAIAFPFEYKNLKFDRLVNYVTGDKSPWIEGFGKAENLVKTFDDKGNHTGFLLVDTDVEPTVMVNLMKFIKTNWSHGPKFNKMIEEGLDDFEALVTCTLDSAAGYYPTGANTYMFASVVDLKKMKEGKVNKFSKGTFKERADYSRRNIQDIFKDPNGIKFAAELEKEGAPKRAYNQDAKAYVEAAKKVFRKYL